MFSMEERSYGKLWANARVLFIELFQYSNNIEIEKISFFKL